MGASAVPLLEFMRQRHQTRNFIEVYSSGVFCGKCCCWVTLKSFPCCSWAKGMYERYFGGNHG